MALLQEGLAELRCSGMRGRRCGRPRDPAGARGGRRRGGRLLWLSVGSGHHLVRDVERLVGASARIGRGLSGDSVVYAFGRGDRARVGVGRELRDRGRPAALGALVGGQVVLEVLLTDDAVVARGRRRRRCPGGPLRLDRAAVRCVIPESGEAEPRAAGEVDDRLARSPCRSSWRR